MRIVIAAVVVSLLSGIQLLPIPPDSLFARLGAHRDAALTALSAYIVFESILSLWIEAHRRTTDYVQTLIAGIVTLVLSVLYLLPLLTKRVLMEFAPYRDIALIVLSLYLIIEAIFAIRNRQKALLVEQEFPSLLAREQHRRSTANSLRIFITGLLALVLGGIHMLPLGPKQLPAALALYRDIGVIALLLYLVLESLVGLGRGRPLPSPITEPPVPEEAPSPPEEIPPPPEEEPSQPGEALVFLSLLQEKGRLLDFLMEDITAYNDAQVAAASRVVHQGCSAVIKEYLDISPVHPGKEGERITIDKSSNPNQYRLVGKVLGEPPFTGAVVHRGWKTSKFTLPRFTRPVDPSTRNIITPAEVELR